MCISHFSSFLVISSFFKNESIGVVAGIVDNNSATSEETAAVSEQQKAQVESMVDMISKFKI